MVRIPTYQVNNLILNINDIYTNGDKILGIKDIFELYNSLYVSYLISDEHILHTENIDTFLNTIVNYPTIVITPKTLGGDGDCSCCNQSM